STVDFFPIGAPATLALTAPNSRGGVDPGHHTVTLSNGELARSSRGILLRLAVPVIVAGAVLVGTTTTASADVPTTNTGDRCATSDTTALDVTVDVAACGSSNALPVGLVGPLVGGITNLLLGGFHL